MKKIIILLAAALLTTGIKAQDTIIFRTGDEVKAKVEKITSTEVEYRNWGNENGPLRVKSVSEVFMIKYANGERELFSEEQHQQPAVKQTFTKPSKELERYSSNIRVKGESAALTDSQLQEILTEREFDSYKSAFRASQVGAVFNVVGWIGNGVAFGLILGGLVGNEPSTLSTGYYIFAACAVPNTIGYCISGPALGRISRVVEGYNERMSREMSMNVNLSPSLMCGFGGIITPGLGVTLTF